jgi:hypothetical protein
MVVPGNPPTPVRDFIDAVRDDQLDRSLLDALHNLLSEEWQHNWYANRDLDALTGGRSGWR